MKLEADCISYRYRRNLPAAISEVTLSIVNGECVAILGESGSGKSTLLGLISGIIQPTNGQISLNGQDIAKISAHERNFAYVMQKPPRLSGITVFDLVIRPATRVYDIATAKSHVFKVLQTLGLKSFENRLLTELSGGELQRAHLARALVWRPQAILFDEPLSSIDVHLKQAIFPLLKKQQTECDSAMILVTHDPREALLLCDRVIILHNGHVIADASTAVMASTPPNLYSAFLMGGVGTNLINVDVRAEPDDSITLRTLFGEIRGRFVETKKHVSQQDKLLALFRWDDLIPVEDGRLNCLAATTIFTPVTATSHSISSPAIFVSASQTVYARPTFNNSDKLSLKSIATKIPLYDESSGALWGCLSVSDSV